MFVLGRTYCDKMLQILLVVGFIGVQIGMVNTYTTCRDGWLAYKGSCYWFGQVESPMDQTTAEEYCRHHNSHLVHVSNSDENDFLKDRMRQLKVANFWMGLTDELSEGHWLWSDTDTTATFLDFNPADRAHNDEDCAIFYSAYDFQWADALCTYKTTPVCEMQGWSNPEGIVG